MNGSKVGRLGLGTDFRPFFPRLIWRAEHCNQDGRSWLRCRGPGETNLSTSGGGLRRGCGGATSTSTEQGFKA